MRKKIRIVAFAMGLSAVMCSQTFAVTYAPNKNDNISIDKVAMLEEETTFTQEDVDKVLNFYSTRESLTLEEFEKYDLNGDGYINSVDASMILDRID